MQLKLLKPCGFCEGVTIALTKARKIVKKHRGQQIYLIGPLVHNRKVISELNKLGVILIDEPSKSRLTLLKKIKNYNSVIILSAHGSSVETINYGRTHFKYFYDLTCRHVNNNFSLVKKYLKDGFNILFIGKKNHPEAIAASSISKRVIVIETLKDVKQIKLNKEEYVAINQTTMNQNIFKPIIDFLILNRINYINTTCNATRYRYDNILNLDKTSTLIVVGDSRSNNTMQLAKLAKSRHIKTFLVGNLNDFIQISKYSLRNVFITSGTSTDIETINQITTKLKTY